MLPQARAALGCAMALISAARLCAFPIPSEAAAPADREGFPATHRLLTAAPPGQTQWLLAAPPGWGPSPRADTLLALTQEGDFYILRPRHEGGGAGVRLIVERYPIPSSLASRVPPARLAGGRFAGAGRDGAFFVIHALEREWRFVHPSAPLSVLSRPVPLAGNVVVAVGADGSLLLFRERKDRWSEAQRIPAGGAEAPGAAALPDALLAAADLDGDGRKELIVPAAPSPRYGHGVLGDALEPTEVRAYRLEEGGLRLLSTFPAGGEAVFEALGALAADLDGDGREEVLITRSEDPGGAAHTALALRGGRLVLKARGAAVGRGYRWSHLLGAFDVNGAGKKILAVETPHLAGHLIALRLHGEELRERARRAGFTTHAVGSRNLWQYALMRRGGVIEVVLQEAGGRRLAALALFGKRWTLRWTHPLAAPPHSNFLAADFNGDGHDDLAFADRKGTVHLLLSRGR